MIQIRSIAKLLLLGSLLLLSKGVLAFTLSGTIYGGGTPLAKVSVKAILSSDQSAAGEAVTDGNGRYSISLNNGTYGLVISPPGDSGFASSSVSDIVIAGANVQQDVVLISGASQYSGVVRGLGGVALAGANVAIYDSQRNTQIASPAPRADGGFSASLAPGDYSVTVSANRNWWIYLPDGTWQSGSLPQGAPDYIYYTFYITIPAGGLAQDVQIPFVELKGKTTDSNGVAVGNVGLTTYNSASGYSESWQYVGGWTINFGAGNIASDSAGNYSMWLLPAYSSANVYGNPYIITVRPPADSGFANTPVGNISVTGDALFTVILPFTDRTAPKVLAGPLATQVNQKQATILWQTDEPAKGSVTVGNRTIEETAFVTHHSVLIDDLLASTSYTAEVTATDKTGNGPTRGSVTFTTSTAPDNRPPLIVAGPTVSAITSDSAVVEWETNEPATTVVTGDVSFAGVGYATVHKVELRNLQSATRYAIRIASSDESGNGPTQRQLHFTTLLSADTTAPVILKGPWFVDITGDGATVVWETDELSNSGVSYNDGVAYGVLNDDALSLTHSVRMTGLKPDTMYHVTVSSKDAFGNGPTLSAPFDVRTLSVADTVAPVFLETPTACNINRQLIQLCFRTDEPASVVIEYGTHPNDLGSVEARAQLLRQHTMPINGLSPLTAYFFRVSVTDEAGNTSVSAPIQTTTLSGGNGTPSFLAAPTVAYKSKDRAVISWETNRPCSALVEYGESSFDLQASDGQLRTKHSIVLPNLVAGQSYQFRVTATDVDGNKVEFGF